MNHSIYTIYFNPFTEMFDVRNRVTGRTVMRDLFCRAEAELVQTKLHDAYNTTLRQAIEANRNGIADRMLADLSTNGEAA